MSEHGTQEVKDAKIAEINDLIEYDVVEEVKYKGQEKIQYGITN